MSVTTERHTEYAVKFPDQTIAGISDSMQTTLVHLAAFSIASLDDDRYAEGEIVSREITTTTMVETDKWSLVTQQDFKLHGDYEMFSEEDVA